MTAKEFAYSTIRQYFQYRRLIPPPDCTYYCTILEYLRYNSFTVLPFTDVEIDEPYEYRLYMYHVYKVKDSNNMFISSYVRLNEFFDMPELIRYQWSYIELCATQATREVCDINDL